MQSFTDIADTTSLTASRSLLLDNDRTVMSNSSGTAFPTTNLQIGMFCLRTDQMKLYELTALTPVWTFVLDLSMISQWGQYADLGGGVDLNTLNAVSGWYHQNLNANTSLVLNYPVALAGKLEVFVDGDMVYQTYQIYDGSGLYFRTCYMGTWNAWRRIWHSGSMGASSGLDADLLDGQHGAYYMAASVIPSGTRMPFAQAAAPTGWTQDTSDNATNRMLRVVNTAGNGVGGSASPILNNVVPVHTHGFTTGTVSVDHSHGIGDPGHAHSIAYSGVLGFSSGGGYGGTAFGGANNQATAVASTGIWTGGISANHTHSGSTDNGSSQTNWTPRYIDMIICSKN